MNRYRNSRHSDFTLGREAIRIPFHSHRQHKFFQSLEKSPNLPSDESRRPAVARRFLSPPVATVRVTVFSVTAELPGVFGPIIEPTPSATLPTQERQLQEGVQGGSTARPNRQSPPCANFYLIPFHKFTNFFLNHPFARILTLSQKGTRAPDPAPKFCDLRHLPTLRTRLPCRPKHPRGKKGRRAPRKKPFTPPARRYSL